MANSAKSNRSKQQKGSRNNNNNNNNNRVSNTGPFSHLRNTNSTNASSSSSQHQVSNNGSSSAATNTHSSASLHQAPIHSPSLPGCIIRLGHQYKRNLIMGSNARCIALLDALKEVMSNWYQLPQVRAASSGSNPLLAAAASSPQHQSGKSLSRDFLKKLEPMIDYLTQCRPLSISMGNALNHLKMHIGHLSPSLSEQDQQEEIIDVLDSYINENIELATRAIASKAAERIRDGDVIMTYARSQSVEKAIILAHERHNKKFRVIVTDSAPKYEGKELMRRLSNAGIQCTYVLINAVSLMCREVTKVMVGAHAMFSNGVLMSRVGTASVAMVANGYNIPVLVCCETYKFSKKTQLKAITKNEVADSRELISNDTFEQWSKKQSLDVLNLIYDITPMEYIDMVVTELGCLPPTSIPVILREQNILK